VPCHRRCGATQLRGIGRVRPCHRFFSIAARPGKKLTRTRTRTLADHHCGNANPERCVRRQPDLPGWTKAATSSDGVRRRTRTVRSVGLRGLVGFGLDSDLLHSLVQVVGTSHCGEELDSTGVGLGRAYCIADRVFPVIIIASESASRCGGGDDEACLSNGSCSDRILL
jgi:hypothetical protein